MGQFGNQPDFGTEAVAITASDTISRATSQQSSCLYVGVGGNVKVILSGVVAPSTPPALAGLPTAAQAVLFKNVPNGSFLPVIVDYVLATGTTATDIIAIK
tara:strand:+ start:412 stop:714 length:303 start_codon:yes stop_codon:yes gene_type:complete